MLIQNLYKPVLNKLKYISQVYKINNLSHERDRDWNLAFV